MSQERATGVYNLKEVQELARAGRVVLTKTVWKSIDDDLLWDKKDVVDFILSLRPGKFDVYGRHGGNYYRSRPVVGYKSDGGQMDIYKSRDFRGQAIYTHFYINEGFLEINSLKLLEGDDEVR